MLENPRRAGSNKFYNKCFENSRSQIVFRTDIFPKLTLGAPEVGVLVLSHFVKPVALCNKKAVALCNNRPSHFVIKKAVALCNKLEIDGRLWITGDMNSIN